MTAEEIRRAAREADYIYVAVGTAFLSATVDFVDKNAAKIAAEGIDVEFDAGAGRYLWIGRCQ